MAARDPKLYLAERRGAQVTSLDIALQLLHQTRRKAVTDRVNADACALPFADASFDLVISSECLERMRGFHLVPPLFRPTWPLLRRLDALGVPLGPVMLNIAVLATRTHRR